MTRRWSLLALLAAELVLITAGYLLAWGAVTAFGQTATPTVAAIDCADEAGFVLCPPEDHACTCVCIGDVNRDNVITVDELLTVLQNAVHGCPRSPSGQPKTCWGAATYPFAVTMPDIQRVVNENLNGCPPGEVLP